MRLRLQWWILLWLAAAPLAAQRPDSVARADRTSADSVRRITPGQAFRRSVLVPGWGQFSAGAPRRAYTFIGLQTGSAFMLAKTLVKLSDAHKVEDQRIEEATDSLNTLMANDTAQRRRLSDPEVFDSAVAISPGLVRVRRLISSREQQRQDWVTYVLVSTLASGVDAFVAAHLADFPARVDAEPRTGGGLNLKFTLPTRRR